MTLHPLRRSIIACKLCPAPGGAQDLVSICGESRPVPVKELDTTCCLAASWPGGTSYSVDVATLRATLLYEAEMCQAPGQNRKTLTIGLSLMSDRLAVSGLTQVAAESVLQITVVGCGRLSQGSRMQ